LAERIEAVQGRLTQAEEDENFWARRFLTIVGLANTAGVVALGTAFVQSGNQVRMARMVEVPIHSFAIGMLLAGSIPLIRMIAANRAVFVWSWALNSLEHNKMLPVRGQPWPMAAIFLKRLAVVVAVAAGAMFLWGLILSLGSIRGVVAGAH